MFEKRKGFVFKREKINNCNVVVCDGETTFSTDAKMNVYSSESNYCTGWVRLIRTRLIRSST